VRVFTHRPANAIVRHAREKGAFSGTYLHDTPERELLTNKRRHLSNGCIRLEDAYRVMRWP
jgi:hypothetical protein